MAGPSASEAETIAVWKAAVDLLEVLRVHADDTQAVGAGKLDTLEQALVGTYIPAPVAVAAANFRAGLSDLMDATTIRGFLDPVIREWGLVIDADTTDTYGGAYEATDAILEAMYEFFIAQGTPTTIETRAITYDTSFTYGAINGSLVGAGKLKRCTVDENAYNLENCTIQKHHFRCRQDANTGIQAEAEVFEHVGSSARKDNLRAADHGSGPDGIKIISLNAGGDSSLLSNSSFELFTSGNNPKFDLWDESFSVMTTSGVATSTTVYRSFPSESTAQSCKLTVTGGSTNRITLKQTVANMRTNQLDDKQPYYCRVMVKDGGSAAGGTITLKLGKVTPTGTASLAISSLHATNWVELFVPLDKDAWLKNFNEDPLDVEIEWVGGTAGTVLWDDMILAPMTLIDGTYWVISQDQPTPTRWLVDDTIELEDTGTLGNGKLQYYIYRGYGRYLPSAGSPTISDP